MGGVTGKELHTLTGNRLLGFAADGKTLITVSDQTIKFRDAVTGTELRTITGVSELLSSYKQAFSPDFKLWAGITPPAHRGGRPPDKAINLWDIATGAKLRTLEGHSDIAAATAFSPDGTTLASGSHDKTIKLWNVATGTEIRMLKGHSDLVIQVALSPDGTILASGSGDSTIKLWDVATGTEVHTLRGHSQKVEFVAFSPDSKTIVSGRLTKGSDSGMSPGR